MIKNALVFQKTYSYDDVMLVPQFNKISSRWDVNLTYNYRNGLNLDVPIFSSPMDTVTDWEMARTLVQNFGAAPVIHRYNTPEKQLESLTKAVFHLGSDKEHTIGCAIGNSRDYLERLRTLLSSETVKPAFINIDVAHGHSQSTFEAVEKVRQYWPGHLMVGNVCTFEAARELANIGVDSLRVGVGSGSACSTRIVCGHGVPMISAIEWASNGVAFSKNKDVAIIADGGIKNSGDAVKAIAAGAHGVMLGSILSGTSETPGDVVIHEGRESKEYRGMASKAALEAYKGSTAKHSSFEGVSTFVPYKGETSEVLLTFLKGLRSGFTYSGSHTIDILQAKAVFTEISANGMRLSHPHHKAQDE